MSIPPSPFVVVLAGPNGAGKSTAGPTLLRDTLGVSQLVDADTIARGLSAFDPGRVALAAGKIMIQRVRELARQRSDFAFETTLAGRAYARWLGQLKDVGYRIHIVFLHLSSADLAVRRVADRVRMGGHDIPEGIVRRRYLLGLSNFFRLYRPLATTWRFYDNSRALTPRLIACGRGTAIDEVTDEETWSEVRRNEGSEEEEEGRGNDHVRRQGGR